MDTAGHKLRVWGPIVGALIGVVLMPDPAALVPALPQELSVLALILSLAYLAVRLDDSGFFEWCALWILRLGGGHGRRLLAVLFGGVSVVTFFTSNDIVILAMTPLVLHLSRRARLPTATPLLVTLFIAANTASMGLYIGNPTNVVIADAVGTTFRGYAARMALPTMVATATALVAVMLRFGLGHREHRVPARYAMPPAAVRPWSSAMTLECARFGTCLVLLTFASSCSQVVAITVAFAVSAALTERLRRALTPGRRPRAGLPRWRRLPLEIVPFFLGLCVVLTALDQAGLTRWLAARLGSAFALGPWPGTLATCVAGIVAVNSINNIPASLLLSRVTALSTLDPASADMAVDAALVAVNIGANVSVHGALAGLMWLRIVGRQRGGGTRLPSARDLTVHGSIIVAAVVLVTSIVIAVCHPGG